MVYQLNKQLANKHIAIINVEFCHFVHYYTKL